jgi:glycosyltransferase involved in cell wall biosynthesis
VRIAILGTRGIPARYGGFETFAEELSTRLAARGHRVTVYCRDRYESAPGHIAYASYRGVDLVWLPTIRHKYLDTLAHTFLSTIHMALRRGPYRIDAALYCNAANAVFTILSRFSGIPVALNVDGIERKRQKWNRYARAWYFVSEYLSTVFPNRFVTDAETIRRYYRENWSADSLFIPYGADTSLATTREALDRLGLEPGRYFLYVSRLEPENRALEVRQAFENLMAENGADPEMKLALIGDAPYASEYIRRVRNTKDPRVVMPGAIYGTGYAELETWCFAYVHATEVGGTHPALIEAMARGALVLYLDTTENREVCGDAGLPFTGQADLTVHMSAVLRMSETERQRLRACAMQRARERYNWDAVTTQYEALLSQLRK